MIQQFHFLVFFWKMEETIVTKHICAPLFTAALFTIANIWREPKCPSIDESKSQTWQSHWARMHTMAYDWWLHFFGEWKSSSELGMGYYWTFTMEVRMDFLKYSNHPLGMGYPLQLEFWCWRINFEIINKIRYHLDSVYYHRSIKKCHSTQPPSPNPLFNEFVSKIHDCIKHTCIKHQWFPFRVEAYYWGKDSFIHITNYTTLYILPFCKSLYLKFDKGTH